MASIWGFFVDRIQAFLICHFHTSDEVLWLANLPNLRHTHSGDKNNWGWGKFCSHAGIDVTIVAELKSIDQRWAGESDKGESRV